MDLRNFDQSYIDFLNNLKIKIKTAQIKASLSVNTEMILLYWDIGQTILDRQKKEAWGAKIIDRLSLDLQKSFPNMKGFSARNLKYMRKFAESYPDFQIVQQLVAQLPWGHNIILLDKVKSEQERLWFANQTIKNGWSRNILIHQVESGLYQRQAVTKKTTNFDTTLPAPQSDLAKQMLKDPYKFDFLTIGEKIQERDLEKELVKHITKFLLELGSGFAFINNQYHLEVAGQDYYIDLLFYHLRLRCYIVIELKIGKFKPEYAGKINFYLSAIDDLLKQPTDNPSIGIILCKSKDRVIVEYALKDMSKPIGVSEYKLVESIPEELKTDLPTIEEFEAELSND